jgi:hypothetical protein
MFLRKEVKKNEAIVFIESRYTGFSVGDVCGRSQKADHFPGLALLELSRVC